MKKPVFPARVKKGFEVIRRTHKHSGEVMYVQVHITRQKPLHYYTASTEFDFMQVKDHQQEKDWIMQNFAEAVPTRNSVVVERSIEPAEKKDVKDMSLVEMITAGLTEDQITKELSRRKKNKANKKYKAAQKAKKEKAQKAKAEIKE